MSGYVERVSRVAGTAVAVVMSAALVFALVLACLEMWKVVVG